MSRLTDAINLDMDAIQQLQQDIIDRNNEHVYDTSQLQNEHELLCNFLKSIDLKKLEPALKRPEMNQAELNEILDAHEKWLLGEKGGKKANLSNLNLSYLDMSNRDLSYIDFCGSDLTFVDMSYSNVLEAKFADAVVDSMKIAHACFYKSDFRFAQISGYCPQDNAFYGAYGTEAPYDLLSSVKLTTLVERNDMEWRIKEVQAGHNIKKQKNLGR